MAGRVFLVLENLELWEVRSNGVLELLDPDPAVGAGGRPSRYDYVSNASGQEIRIWPFSRTNYDCTTSPKSPPTLRSAEDVLMHQNDSDKLPRRIAS